MLTSRKKEIIRNKDLSIDLMKYEVKKGSTSIDLTVREFELLKFLASKKTKFSLESSY